MEAGYFFFLWALCDSLRAEASGKTPIKAMKTPLNWARESTAASYFCYLLRSFFLFSLVLCCSRPKTSPKLNWSDRISSLLFWFPPCNLFNKKPFPLSSTQLIFIAQPTGGKNEYNPTVNKQAHIRFLFLLWGDFFCFFFYELPSVEHSFELQPTHVGLWVRSEMNHTLGPRMTLIFQWHITDIFF